MAEPKKSKKSTYDHPILDSLLIMFPNFHDVLVSLGSHTPNKYVMRRVFSSLECDSVITPLWCSMMSFFFWSAHSGQLRKPFAIFLFEKYAIYFS